MGHRRVRLSASVAVAVLKDILAEPRHIVQLGVGGGEELPILQEAFPRAQFTGIDPDPDSARLWQGKYPGAYIRAAIGEKHGAFANFRSARDWRFRRELPVKRQYRVPVVSLDGLLAARGTFGSDVLLWGDCEGAELAALRGGTKFMESVQWAWIETTDAPENVDWPDSQQVIDKMSALGFRAWHRSGYYFPPRWSGDTLFCRRV